MVLFGLKTHSKKFFIGYLYPPTLSMQKIRSKWSLNRFLEGRALNAPPTAQDAFERVWLVGLSSDCIELDFKEISYLVF